MDGRVPVGHEGGKECFVYFVVRIRRDGSDGAAGPTGVLERLGSGRARRFDGAQELLVMLTDATEETSSSGR